MYEQPYEYLNNYLNDLFCGFRKAHSTQHVLSRLIQSLKKKVDNSDLVGTILMDLSKAYDCLPHDLLKQKLKHMVLINLVLIWLIITYVFGNKGEKLVFRIVTGLMLLGDPPEIHCKASTF